MGRVAVWNYALTMEEAQELGFAPPEDWAAPFMVPVLITSAGDEYTGAID